jgi:RecA/RadA recombinase
MDRAMTTPERPTDRPLGDALARLEARWGSAAIRLGNGARVERGGPARTGPAEPQDRPGRGLAIPDEGALAPVLLPRPDDTAARPHPLQPLPDEVVSTGFPALDAVLGTGGLPRQASATIRGSASSGKTTLALRCLAEAQAHGAIVAWLDLTRAFDPLEAVSRGVDLRWLVVVRPADPGEGFRLAGALLSGRAIDLLVVDLPRRLSGRQDQLVRRLSAHVQRIGARLVVLEPAGLDGRLQGALAEVSHLRLELARRDWIRLGRDVVGQRTEVTVAKNRFGPPGHRVEVEIRYAEEGERDPALARRLDDTGPPAALAPADEPPTTADEPPTPLSRTFDDATPPAPLDPPPAPTRTGTLRAVERPARARRPALGAGHGPRLQPGRAPARGTPRPAARGRP